MTHQRPIPAANQPPFPRQFAPHSETHAEEGVDAPSTASAKAQGDTDKGSWSGLSARTLGAAAGIGSAALLAALLYAGRRNGGRTQQDSR
jgi:hypothetical protein